MADRTTGPRPPDRPAADPGRAPHPSHVAHPAPPEHAVPRSPAWPWLAVLAVAVVTAGLLAWHPWTSSAPGTPPAPGTTTPAPSPGDTSPVQDPDPTVPGDPTAGFDDDTLGALFLTDAELAEAVPDAAGLGLAPADEAVWGLPAGSGVTPASCTTAVTVVEQEPDGFARRFASDATVTVIQSVDLLPDAAAAREAFDALVDVLGVCDAYQQVAPGVDGGAWESGPSTTSPGDVATTVRRTVLTAEGASSPEVVVTARVANALVTTPASAVDPAGEPADPATLAAVARAAGERALAEVAAAD